MSGKGCILVLGLTVSWLLRDSKPSFKEDKHRFELSLQGLKSQNHFFTTMDRLTAGCVLFNEVVCKYNVAAIFMCRKHDMR